MSMIHEKMIAIMRNVEAIGKNNHNTQQNFMYRGIDQVMNELHGLFATHGVFVTTNLAGEINVTEHTNAKGTVIFRCRIPYQFTFWAEDGTSVSSTVVGEAMDSGDKGANKAVSIALKYALLQALLIPTEESKDPDAESHDIIDSPEYIEAIELAKRLGNKDAENYINTYRTNIDVVRMSLSKLKKEAAK